MERTHTDTLTSGHAAKETRERRTFAGRVEVRAATDGSVGTIVGYAAVFNQETVIGRYFPFREVIAPGAFAEAIKTDDVRALFNHDPNLVLGRNVAKTLRLEEDSTGLRYEIDLPDTTAARDVKTLIERGDVSGSSFAFEIVSSDDEEWDDSPVKDGKLPLRTIKKMSLYDVSPVTYPAYEGTSVSARSAEQAKACTERAAAAKADPATVDPATARALVQRAQARMNVEDAKACRVA